MSNAILKGNASGTGSVTLESPNTNSDRTIALPDADGTVMVSGNMPAFSAYQSVQQTLSANTYTKINFQTEEFDTNSNFDNSAMRFTPSIAGYYQLTGGINGASANISQVVLYKNGSLFKYLQNGSAGGLWGTVLVYANGTTDYFELWGYTGTGQSLNSSGSQLVYFQGAMVRSVA